MFGGLPARQQARGSLCALFSLVAGLVALTGPAYADKVGVAAAVNPDAFSSLSGSPKTQLNIGKSIFFNERINTTGSGLVQVLLIDGSTFTVGPGSDLVIDRFVYDPNKKTGEVVATFSKGAMRFVGGKISKNPEGVTVNTPAGALAIRGGMFQGTVNGSKGVFSFLYGETLTLTGKNGRQFTVFQPGNTIDTTTGIPNIRQTTPGDVAAVMTQLTNGNSNGIGNDTSSGNTGTQGSSSKYTSVETLSLQDLISDAMQTQINDQLNNQEQQDKTDTADTTDTTEPPVPDIAEASHNETSLPTDNTPPAENTPPAGNTPPPPVQLTARVLTSPGVYTAFPGTSAQFTTGNAGSSGVLGGGSYPEGASPPFADDFVSTFKLSNGRLLATVSGLTDAHCSGENCSEIEASNLPPAEIDFPATGQCVNGVCPITASDHATITQGGKTATYEGLAVFKKDFFAYQLASLPGGTTDNNSISNPLLVFGGKAYNFGAPSGRTYAFILTPDILQVQNGAFAPFASGASSPTVNSTGPQPTISPLLYLETDSAAANDPSRAVWLQTSLYISTTPQNGETSFDQQSFVNLALGGVDSSSGGLIGARRGGSNVDVDTCGDGCINREQLAFTGDIATLGGPDGSHFLGSENPNVVIGFDSTGTHNIGRDGPLDPSSTSVEDQSGSTYHVGVGIGTLPPQPQTFQGEYKGYAVGIVRSEVPATDFANVVGSASPEDFHVTFDKGLNALWATATVRDVQNYDGATSSYSVGFGDNAQSPANKSAYIDDLHYAAIESGSAAVVNGSHNYAQTSATAYLVSGDQLNVTSFFPETFPESSPGSGSPPICTNCDFVKWGAWGARFQFSDGSDSTRYFDNVHLGWWVAGDITPLSDLDKLGAQNATATYNGHVIGDVANNLSGDGWKTYVAAGDLAMNWSFAQRSGDLTISKFDTAAIPGGLTFQGPMTAPGVVSNQFGGSLSGSVNNLPLSGSAVGSFVNNGLTNPAAGIIGNWNIADQQRNFYKAGGILAGVGTPVPGH
jgi:trimeric autotransporter adhesin